MILGSELKAEFWQHAIAVVFTAIFQLLEYVQTSVMHPMQPKLCREVSIIPADRGRVLEYKFLPTVFGLNTVFFSVIRKSAKTGRCLGWMVHGVRNRFLQYTHVEWQPPAGFRCPAIQL